MSVIAVVVQKNASSGKSMPIVAVVLKWLAVPHAIVLDHVSPHKFTRAFQSTYILSHFLATSTAFLASQDAIEVMFVTD